MKILDKIKNFIGKKEQKEKEQKLLAEYEKGLYLRVDKDIDNKELMENLKKDEQY